MEKSLEERREFETSVIILYSYSFYSETLGDVTRETTKRRSFKEFKDKYQNVP